jgi:hypothetical protein
MVSHHLIADENEEFPTAQQARTTAKALLLRKQLSVRQLDAVAIRTHAGRNGHVSCAVVRVQNEVRTGVQIDTLHHQHGVS